MPLDHSEYEDESSNLKVVEEDENKLEFALTELFNYYARTYDEKSSDFDSYHN